MNCIHRVKNRVSTKWMSFNCLFARSTSYYYYVFDVRWVRKPMMIQCVQCSVHSVYSANPAKQLIWSMKAHQLFWLMNIKLNWFLGSWKCQSIWLNHFDEMNIFFQLNNKILLNWLNTFNHSLMTWHLGPRIFKSQ